MTRSASWRSVHPHPPALAWHQATLPSVGSEAHVLCVMSQEELREAQSELAAKGEELREAQRELAAKGEEVREAQRDLAAKGEEVREAQRELAAKEGELCVFQQDKNDQIGRLEVSAPTPSCLSLVPGYSSLCWV